MTLNFIILSRLGTTLDCRTYFITYMVIIYIVLQLNIKLHVCKLDLKRNKTINYNLKNNLKTKFLLFGYILSFNMNVYKNI